MNKQPLFIVLIPGFPASESDKNCLPFQQKFVKAFKEDHPEMQVAVIAFQYPYTKTDYRWYDIPVISFGGKNRGGLFRLLLRRRLFRKLLSLHKEYNITGILSFWCGECAIAGKKFAVRHRLIHYCWICGQDAVRENKYPKRMNAQPGDFIALSDFLQEEFHSNHQVRPAHVITPGIDVSDFSNTKRSKEIDLLAAGSLIALKQFEIYIETVAVLKRSYPAIKAILVGEGPEREKMEDLVRLYRLEDHLEIKGELSHSELMELMQRTKLLIHPSRYEGFSGVCLEALHAGASVISFVNPMKEKIANWHIAKNKEDMAEIAEALLEKSEVRESPATVFDIHHTVKTIGELYRI